MKNLILIISLLFTVSAQAQVAGWFTSSDAVGTAEPATFYNQMLLDSNSSTIRVKAGANDPSAVATHGEVGDLYISTNGKTYQNQSVATSTSWTEFVSFLDVLVNPSFEDDDVDRGWTITSGTASAETVNFLPSEGSQALELSVTASPFEMYQTFDCSDYSAIPLGFTAYVSASATSELEVCGFDGSVESNCTSLYSSATDTDVVGYQKILAENTGGGTCGIKIKSDATITETINIDGIEFTKNPYRFVDVGNVNDFSALLTSTGVVSNENENFLEGDCTNAHPQVCTLVTGKFSVAPVCDVDNSGDAAVFCFAYGESTTGFNIKCYSDAGGSASNSYAKSVQCTRSDGDYKSVADHVATSAKSNLTGWKAYDPVTQGFGTETSTQYFYKVVGSSVLIIANFDTGTVAPSEAQLGLPIVDGVQLTVDSALTIPYVVGECARNLGTTTDIRVTATGGDAFVNFSQDTVGYKTAQNGSTIFGSTESVTVTSWLIPTNELDSVSTLLAAIPVLIPSVSVDASEVLTENDNSFVTSCTNADPSVCTFSGGYWTADPKCWAEPIIAGEIAAVTLDTTTSVTIDRTSAAGPFKLFCTGKRAN